MFLFIMQRCIAVIILFEMVQSLPIPNTSINKSSAAVDSPVIMSNIIHKQLTNRDDNSTGLLPLWEEAKYLAKENVLKAQYQRWKQTQCKDQMFSVKTVKNSCKGQENTTLTYSQLTNYYNELVIQLRLAEHNLNATIAMEVKEEHLSDELEREKRIIKLLNENILPALEVTLNISTSNTNCSATTALVTKITSLYDNCAVLQTSNTILAQTSLSLYNILDNPIISLYSNCATLQTFNTFLAQTSLSLHRILDDPNQITLFNDDDGIMVKQTVSNCKNRWCIV